MTEIRITDPYVINAVKAEQELRRDKRGNHTAGHLIIERLTDLGRPPIVRDPNERKAKRTAQRQAA